MTPPIAIFGPRSSFLAILKAWRLTLRTYPEWIPLAALAALKRARFNLSRARYRSRY
jgi:hypothetical protein